jgi:hypothetical protein
MLRQVPRRSDSFVMLGSSAGASECYIRKHQTLAQECIQQPTTLQSSCRQTCKIPCVMTHKDTAAANCHVPQRWLMFSGPARCLRST